VKNPRFLLPRKFSSVQKTVSLSSYGLPSHGQKVAQVPHSLQRASRWITCTASRSPSRAATNVLARFGHTSTHLRQSESQPRQRADSVVRSVSSASRLRVAPWAALPILVAEPPAAVGSSRSRDERSASGSAGAPKPDAKLVHRGPPSRSTMADTAFRAEAIAFTIVEAPVAASPSRNTPAIAVSCVAGSVRPAPLNPIAASAPGSASVPVAVITVSAGKDSRSSVGTGRGRPSASGSPRRITLHAIPPSAHRSGVRRKWKRTPSARASSYSSREAGISCSDLR